VRIWVRNKKLGSSTSRNISHLGPKWTVLSDATPKWAWGVNIDRSKQLHWLKPEMPQRRSSRIHTVCQKTKWITEVKVFWCFVYEALNTFFGELSELCLELQNRRMCKKSNMKTENSQRTLMLEMWKSVILMCKTHVPWLELSELCLELQNRRLCKKSNMKTENSQSTPVSEKWKSVILMCKTHVPWRISSENAQGWWNRCHEHKISFRSQISDIKTKIPAGTKCVT
jgi:hypothetical protein